MPRRKVVCLCGSTRFKDAFVEANKAESLAGNIVLTVCWFSHADGSLGEDAERVFQELHFDKIDMADEVLVLNCERYIGESTTKEIDYAVAAGKPVRFLE